MSANARPGSGLAGTFDDWDPLDSDQGDLERLDAALGRIRRLWDRPEVKQWFQARLDLESVDASVYRTLRAVRQVAGSDPSVNGVAGVLRVDASTASRFVERAVTAGFVSRSVAPDDRRRSSLELTAAGNERLLVLRDVRVRFLADLTAAWPDDDVVALTGLLDRLDASVGRLDDVDDG
ncbi:MAG TPA: MarR family winged helix-turn-helix transcriptional regulator [Ilumatobacteraceae bacterium]|nr:MarR family winged helix-turn-helix transcriptional regulator [Ilumatobacteraceae bacterium]